MNFERNIQESSISNQSPRQEAMPAMRQYLQFIQRRRAIILGSVGLALLIGAIATLLSTRKYSAVATIEIAREVSKVIDVKGVDEEVSAADVEFYQTQYGLLRSRRLAERVAAKLGLIDDPQFFRIFSMYEESLFPKGGPTPAARAERTRIAGELLLKYMAVNPARLSRLVDISFTAPDPELASRVANTWTSTFIATNLERRFEATAYARDFLENRLEQIRQRLEESERRLVQYAAAQKIVNLPGVTSGDNRTTERSLVADDLAQFNVELGAATAERIKAEARRARSGELGAETEALTNTAINGLRQKRADLSADYQKLMMQFTPEYPAAKTLNIQISALDRSIAREEMRVRNSFDTTYRQTIGREHLLQDRVSKLKSDLLDQRRRSIQYTIYQRDVDTNRQLYDGLLQRYKEIGVTAGVGTNNVSLVDSADIPTKPSSPRLLINILIAALSGLAIGTGLAIARDQLDETIDDSSEVERRIGIPLLGAIPRSKGDPVATLADPKSVLVDAYLSVQTNLAFATPLGTPSTLCVTSTRASEGKSTTALAIATMLAKSGQSVVLVDGDMRSPSVHAMLGLANITGLSEFLSGNVFELDNLQQSNEFGLSILSAGQVPPNAAELLTGMRLRKLIDVLRHKFDNVVIDAPPVMGLADALLIGAAVEGTVFTIEAHAVRANLARTALDRLVMGHVRLFGCVLTMLDAKKASRAYAYDLGYGYGKTDMTDDG